MSMTRRALYRLALGSAAFLGLGGHASIAAAQALRTTGPLTNRDFEPLGGQPGPGARPSVEDFDYQVKYQRAFEAALWAMPALAIYRFRAAALEDLESVPPLATISRRRRSGRRAASSRARAGLSLTGQSR